MKAPSSVKTPPELGAMWCQRGLCTCWTFPETRSVILVFAAGQLREMLNFFTAWSIGSAADHLQYRSFVNTF